MSCPCPCLCPWPWLCPGCFPLSPSAGALHPSPVHQHFQLAELTVVSEPAGMICDQSRASGGLHCHTDTTVLPILPSSFSPGQLGAMVSCLYFCSSVSLFLQLLECIFWPWYRDSVSGLETCIMFQTTWFPPIFIWKRKNLICTCSNTFWKVWM